ncbi:hypothetical protein FSZ31_10895 [Sphingorhabdus soli]|uniref:Uncharacterized protein n=1 Tax=Flavisphingopyxis soli TaxID=2601267 RepID=A0A5C6U5S3_9SPHN|nr:hypothetical protein [Sphingorhabdus soli]TXC68194.1 hypothetical protein FSZ31_10895 [Sphingorhabdus soli]
MVYSFTGTLAVWQPAFDTIRGSLIARCELFGLLPEVAITTDGNTRLLSFSTADGQPQWLLTNRRDGQERWFTVQNGQLHVGDGTCSLRGS